ncbi:uncharacterized protein TNCV_3445291 [Trichonephila clavipes]|nr:uncharacterized protein TNCV_3445291 [Trichonephila clavipes]
MTTRRRTYKKKNDIKQTIYSNGITHSFNQALQKRLSTTVLLAEAYNRVEELIALEDVYICKLEAELNVFKGKVDRLENTCSNILELLPEKGYDADFGVVEEFREKAIRIQTKKQGESSTVNKM